MYYRHLYATLAQPTLEQRRKSWENYVRLFNIMLNTQVNMQVRCHAVQPHAALPCMALMVTLLHVPIYSRARGRQAMLCHWQRPPPHRQLLHAALLSTQTSC